MAFFPPDLSWRGRATFLAHTGKAIFRQHHQELLPVLRPLVPTDGVVVDVGAHAGQFAKLFAQLAPQGRVYAFEPSLYARSILTLAVRARRLNNIEIVAAALGDGAGSAVLSTPVKKAGSVRFGLAHLSAKAESGGRVETVPIVTLDSFFAQRRLDRLSFLKADVEGWEMRMLVGAAETIRRHRPPMLLELVDSHLRRAGDTLPAAWDLLTSWGYEPQTWDGSRVARCDAPRDGDCFWMPRA